MTRRKRILIAVPAIVVVALSQSLAWALLTPPYVSGAVTTTTIVQVNVWCEYLESWILQDEVAAAENWINTQEPFDEVQNAMIEFARCSEFGKETARLLWPLWFGE